MIFLIKAIQLILSLSFLVIIHEFGHFIFARLFGMRVEKFYLFFNPSFTIFRCKKINGSWKCIWFSSNDKHFEDDTESMETEWGIGWLPFGGYCKISGMIDESLDTSQMKKEPQPWEFRTKPAWQRFFVMAGGVTVNFIAALVIYSAILFTWGENYLKMSDTALEFSEIAQQYGYKNGDRILAIDNEPTGKFDESTLLRLLEAENVTIIRENDTLQITPPKGLAREVIKKQEAFVTIFIPATVDSVMNTAPAFGLLKPDDRFVKIGATPVNSFGDLTKALAANTSDTISASVLRGSDTVSISIPLTEDKKIGFYVKNPLNIQTQTFNIWQSIPAGVSYGLNKLSYYIKQMKFIFTKEGAENIGGFGAIGSMFPSFWNWQAFWETTAFLSIILAFMNVLPIPALDGGFILFLLYEIIFRRKPSEKFLMKAQLIGMAFLFTLLIYANGMDILRIFK